MHVYNFKIQNTDVNLKSLVQITQDDMLFLILNLSKARDELDINNLDSSLYRYNTAPQEFPISVKTEFVDYFNELISVYKLTNAAYKPFFGKNYTDSWIDSIRFENNTVLKFEDIIVDNTLVSSFLVKFATKLLKEQGYGDVLINIDKLFLALGTNSWEVNTELLKEYSIKIKNECIKIQSLNIKKDDGETKSLKFGQQIIETINASYAIMEGQNVCYVDAVSRLIKNYTYVEDFKQFAKNWSINLSLITEEGDLLTI